MSNHDDETRDAAAQAQLLYVAYYGRPGDPGGLEFWTNEFMNSDHTDSAVAAFGASAEFAMLSEDKDHGMLVDLLYMQMFNRAPDDAGRDFYVGQLESGEATLASIALDIANGAQGDDMTILHNKIAVANTFTEAVRGADAEYGMSHIPHAQAVLAAVDASDASVMSGNTAAEGLVAQMDGGMTYMLTAGLDVIESGVDNDTYTATTGTISDADVIDDASNTDHDTLNITNTGGVSPSTVGVPAIIVRNVERINIDQDLFKGAEGTIDLSGVMGAKVTISSERLGYDGAVTVSGVGDNTIILGDNVKELTASNVNAANFDLGTATTAIINRLVYTADTSTSPLTTSLAPGSPVLCVNGDIDLTVNGNQAAGANASPYTIKGTADAKVTLQSPGITGTSTVPVPFAVTGDGDMTLIMAAVAGFSITNSKESGTLTVQTAVTGNAGNIAGITGDTTVLFANPGVTGITAGDRQHILFAENSQAAPLTVTVTGTAAMGAPVSATAPTVTNVMVTANKGVGTVSRDQATGAITPGTGGITFNTVKSATLTLAEQAAGPSDVSTLTSDGGPVSVISTGAVTVASLAAAKADFSGVEGDLTIAAIAVSSTVTGGSGKNTVTSPTGTTVLGYQGGAGADTLRASGASPETRIQAELGAGNDALSLIEGAATAGTATINVDGGAGLDTVVLTVPEGTAADLSALTGLTLEGFEVLAVSGLNPTTADDRNTLVDESTAAASVEDLTATVHVDQLAHFSVVATADQEDPNGAVDTLTVTVVSDAKNVDLSGLRLTDGVSFTLNGNQLADGTGVTSPMAVTLIGSSGNDTIDGGAAHGDTLTGGGGADTFVFTTANESHTKAVVNAAGAITTPGGPVDTITDYARGVDRIDVTAATIGAAATTSPAAFDSTNTAVNAILGAGTTVKYTVANGVLRLSGTGADTDMVDTLDEWVILAELANDNNGVIAFAFNGDTYILDEGGSAGTDNLIKLAGVTGVTSLGVIDTNTTPPTVPDADVLIV